MSERPATTRLKCPKCRSRSFVLEERLEASTAWNVNAGALDVAAGINELGNIIGYGATCYSCGHQWRPRGSFSRIVTELQP